MDQYRLLGHALNRTSERDLRVRHRPAPAKPAHEARVGARSRRWWSSTP